MVLKCYSLLWCMELFKPWAHWRPPALWGSYHTRGMKRVWPHRGHLYQLTQNTRHICHITVRCQRLQRILLSSNMISDLCLSKITAVNYLSVIHATRAKGKVRWPDTQAARRSMLHFKGPNSTHFFSLYTELNNLKSLNCRYILWSVLQTCFQLCIHSEDKTIVTAEREWPPL